jgi:hypothetical protein
MSLERKDVRAKLSPETHEKLAALAEFSDEEISALASLYLEKMVVAEFHALSLKAERLGRLGRVGNGRD